MERDALAILRDNDGDAIPRRETPVGRDQGELVIRPRRINMMAPHAAIGGAGMTRGYDAISVAALPSERMLLCALATSRSAEMLPPRGVAIRPKCGKCLHATWRSGRSRSAHAPLAEDVNHREAALVDAVGARGREEQRRVDRAFRVCRAALHVVPHLHGNILL